MMKRKELSAEDRIRVIRLSEEAEIRLHEIGMILARNYGGDASTIQVGQGTPEVMIAVAESLKETRAQKHQVVCFKDQGGVVCCVTHDGGGTWNCNYLG